MTDRLLLDSFIVRIYRSDEDDSRKLTGLVETMDGTGMRAPFSDMDELEEILIRRTRCGKRSGKNIRQSPD